MIRINPRFLLPVLLGAVTAQAAPETITVRHVDLHPASATAAERTVRRIDSAALEACGGSDGSLHEVKAAIRKGDCWREAAGNAIHRSDDPLLAAAFARIAPAVR